ncbi:MAG: hypothetical protein H0X70_09725 [Segetibacter sp.]|nr:hypothetical protein [Segetibacter sp.]
MRWLLFLSRVALICNLFFIACIFFRYKDVMGDQSLRGFVVVVGWLLAPIITVIANVLFITLFILKKKPQATMPGWLLVFNIIMQIVQLIIIPL